VWHDAKEDPPDNDRVVLIRWEDGSSGENTKGFYDSVSKNPPDPKKWWWSYPMTKLPDGAVLMWKECETN
jgi:hypothetical protein